MRSHTALGQKMKNHLISHTMIAQTALTDTRENEVWLDPKMNIT